MEEKKSLQQKMEELLKGEPRTHLKHLEQTPQDQAQTRRDLEETRRDLERNLEDL